LRVLSKRLLSSSNSDWMADQSLIFILFCGGKAGVGGEEG
jgi:hypothetical protein